MTLTGGCLCGSARYTAEGDPAFVAKCYCTHCHKESGTGHITVAAMPEEGFKVTGETRSYGNAEAAGHVARVFCPSCGSTLFSQGARPGFVNIRIGTIDDSSALKPTVAIFGRSASPWDAPPADIHVFEEFPTA